MAQHTNMEDRAQLLQHYYRRPTEMEIANGKYTNKTMYICLECEKIGRNPIYTTRSDAHYDDLLHHYTNPEDEQMLSGN